MGFRRSRRARFLALAAFVLLTAAFALPPEVAAAAEPHDEPSGLDHLHCYRAAQFTQTPFSQPSQVQLQDQFGTATVNVGAFVRLCNPTLETREDTPDSFPPQHPDAKLACFTITQTGFQTRKIRATNEFGSALLDVTGPTEMCLPSFENQQANTFPPDTQPSNLDHFKCYSVRYSRTPSDAFDLEPPTVLSQDDFGDKRPGLGAPLLLCNPAAKTRTDIPESTPITNPDAHLVCYRADEDELYNLQPWVKNQFGTAQVHGGYRLPDASFRFNSELLCIPSTTSAPK
jgi:hypothetical protein